MTLTVHWWMLPLFFVALGGFFWVKGVVAKDECFGGMLETIEALVMFAIAIAVCIGHYL